MDSPLADNPKSSLQEQQNILDVGLSEAQDALLAIIEQQSNRLSDEESGLVPFGEILRDIYETSNQTLNLSNGQPTTIQYQQSNESDQMPTGYHMPYQTVPENHGNMNIMNYLNPFNNSLNFYSNCQNNNNNSNNNTNHNTNNNSTYTSLYDPTAQNLNIHSKFLNYNQNIETLIETVYEDNAENSPVYMNMDAGENDSIDSAQSIYPVEQETSEVYENNQILNSETNETKWGPEYFVELPNSQVKQNCNNNITSQTHYYLQEDSQAPHNSYYINPYLHLNQNAPSSDGQRDKVNVEHQQHYQLPSTSNSYNQHHQPIKMNSIVEPVNTLLQCHDPNILFIEAQNSQNYEDHRQLETRLKLQPNQKYITPDMIVSRPPLQTRQTIYDMRSVEPPTPEIVCETKPPIEENISNFDFSSLDTSDIVIPKIEPKIGEPLHKKRKQDLKIMEGCDNIDFEFIGFSPDYYNDNSMSSSVEELSFNSSPSDDSQIEDFEPETSESIEILVPPFFRSKQIEAVIPQTKTKPILTQFVGTCAVHPNNPVFRENKGKRVFQENVPQPQLQPEPIQIKKPKRTLLKKPHITNRYDTSSSESDYEELLVNNKSLKCLKCFKLFKSAKTLSTHKKRCNRGDIAEMQTRKEKEFEDICSKRHMSLSPPLKIETVDSEDFENSPVYQVEYLDSEPELSESDNEAKQDSEIYAAKQTEICFEQGPDEVIEKELEKETLEQNPQETIAEQNKVELSMKESPKKIITNESPKEVTKVENTKNEDPKIEDENSFRRKTRSQTKKRTEISYYEKAPKAFGRRRK